MPWAPGQSGNPEGAGKVKPFRDALRMEAAALEAGELVDHPKGSLRWNAQRLLINGEVQGIRETADRLDGKVPQAIVGDDEHGPIQVAVVKYTDVADDGEK